MAAGAVVERFDVFEDCVGELGPGAPVLTVEQLELDGMEEAFGHGVVERVADAAHRSQQPRGAEPLPERPAGVLTGFNRWSQHRLVAASVDAPRGLRWVSSS